MTDHERLADLVTFARIEVESGDIEPWAAILASLHRNGVIDVEEAHWLVALYNSFDSLQSAFGVFDRWRSVDEWYAASDRNDVVHFECTQERRNLRGGRVVKRFISYREFLGGQTQAATLGQALRRDDPGRDFDRLMAWTRQVWGVGRQSAFEWAEFLAKVCGYPVDASHGSLWESEGPRRSLQKLYGNPTPTAAWLDERADECRAMLTLEGVWLPWVDFETVICDFNVGRDGRYYPGRHLAAIREEIDLAPVAWRERLEDSWQEVVPPAWQSIAPGIDKTKMPVYRDTGRWIDSP